MDVSNIIAMKDEVKPTIREVCAGVTAVRFNYASSPRLPARKMISQGHQSVFNISNMRMKKTPT